MSIDNTIANKTVYPQGTSVNIRKLPSTTSEIVENVKKGNPAGIATGNFLKMADGDWLQIKTSKGIVAYVKRSVIDFKSGTTTSTTVNNPTVSDAQSLFDSLIAQDKLNYEKGMLVYAQAEVAKKKGIDTTKVVNKLKTLMFEFAERQESIKNIKEIIEIKTSIQTNPTIIGIFAFLNVGSSNFFRNVFGLGNVDYKEVRKKGLGVIPVIAYIIAGVVIAAAAYYLLKPKYDASKANYKEIKELEEILKNYDPETAKKIKDAIEEQLDDAYYKGNLDQFWRSWGGIIKNGFLIAVGAVVTIKAVQYFTKDKK